MTNLRNRLSHVPRLFCCCVPVRAAGNNDCAMSAVMITIVGLLCRVKKRWMLAASTDSEIDMWMHLGNVCTVWNIYPGSTFAILYKIIAHRVYKKASEH